MFQKLGGPRLLAAAAAFCAISGVAQAQVPADEFTPYNPANASSITPGVFSLYSVPVDSLAPTQFNVGYSEIGKKEADWNLVPSSQLQANLLESVEPVVIGPGGTLYQINGHHTFDSLQQSIYGASNPNVYVNVVANYSGDTPAQFLAALQSAAQVYPLNNGVLQTLTPTAGNPLSPIPTSISGLTNDPYRGLEFQALKNKGSAGIAFDKTSAPFADFVWANAYRDATTAHGTGLPFLTPADVNAAAAWSQTGTNTVSLPGGVNTTVSKLPGYSLTGGIVLGGGISNTTLANGALDGSVTGGTAASPLAPSSASFNGMNGYSIGSIQIQPTTPGFIMQLGAGNSGTNTVTLTGTNTYTGGTTIYAGVLVAQSDAALGTQAAAGTAIDPNNVASSVQNAGGIVFDSLSEGNGTLRFGTTSGGTFTTSRNIAIGQETANFDMNGNTVNLNGGIASFAVGEGGLAALTVNDNTGTGTLVLNPTNGATNANFYGNLVISNGTLQVSSDAAMGAVTNPGGAIVGGSNTSEIGQIDLDGGTFKAGASLTSARSLFLTGSSTFDTGGFQSTFAGTLSDTQRTLTVTNSGTSANGSVAFGAFDISSTATLALNHGASSNNLAVTFTNGINRDGNATLFMDPSGSTALLGAKEKVFSSGASTTLTNGIVAPWMVMDSGGSASSSPYTFMTYGANGYVSATTSSVTTATTTLSGSSGSRLVISSGATLASGGAAYALQVQSGSTITVGSGQTLTIGDGTVADGAGLILDDSATITGGKLAFGNSEALIYVKGTTNPNTIASTITGSGGITLSGSGELILSAASQNAGAVVVNSGTLALNVANALSTASSVYLEDVKSSPSATILTLNASQTFSQLSSAGNNSTINLASGMTLTIGDSQNQSSTLSSTITDGGATSGIAGALTKAGTGLLDLSGGSSGKIQLNSASTIAVNAGQLRIGTNQIANANTITTLAGTELQTVAGGTGSFASNITGGGALHIMEGTLQLTGTGNNYSGGTIMEVGSYLVATTANLSSAAGAQSIVNSGGTLVLDQTSAGNFTAIMSDGVPGTDGQTGAGSASGSLVKADSASGNTGNVTITNAQLYTGATTVEGGTLTLGAVDTVKTSSGVALGTVGGGATANLALGADNTVQGLNSVAGNTTGVQLNGHALTVQQNAGAVSGFTGNVSDTGAGSVNTTGGGALALSGTNSIGGSMTVGASTTVSQTGGSLSVATGNTTSTTTVTNNGTMSFSNTAATFGGTFVNNGTIMSDPSTMTFNNLSLSTTGSIQASAGDLYKVGGNLLNSSMHAATWNTSQAALEFYDGSSTSHTMQLTAADGGATLPIGRATFTWGSLTVDAGNTLTLASAFGSSGFALYADGVIGASLSGDDVTNIIGDGFNIYYDPYDAANAYLDGATYDLVDGGVLAADVPEPSSLLLLLGGLGGGALVRRRRNKRRA